MLFKMGGIRLTGELSRCLDDAKSALKIIKPFVECLKTNDKTQLNGTIRIVIPPQQLVSVLQA